MDYEILPTPRLKYKMYHPIGVESLYVSCRFHEKISTTYLRCYFGRGQKTCRGTALIKDEKLFLSLPCQEPHPEVQATILESRKRAALQEALKTKSEDTTLRKWYEDTLKK